MQIPQAASPVNALSAYAAAMQAVQNVGLPYYLYYLLQSAEFGVKSFNRPILAVPAVDLQSARPELPCLCRSRGTQYPAATGLLRIAVCRR